MCMVSKFSVMVFYYSETAACTLYRQWEKAKGILRWRSPLRGTLRNQGWSLAVESVSKAERTCSDTF